LKAKEALTNYAPLFLAQLQRSHVCVSKR